MSAVGSAPAHHEPKETIAAQIRVCRRAGFTTAQTATLTGARKEYVRAVTQRMRKPQAVRNLEGVVATQGEHIRALTILVAQLKEKIENISRTVDI